MSTTHLVGCQYDPIVLNLERSRILQPNAVSSFHLFERSVDVGKVLTVGNDCVGAAFSASSQMSQ